MVWILQLGDPPFSTQVSQPVPIDRLAICLGPFPVLILLEGPERQFNRLGPFFRLHFGTLFGPTLRPFPVLWNYTETKIDLQGGQEHLKLGVCACSLFQIAFRASFRGIFGVGFWTKKILLNCRPVLDVPVDHRVLRLDVDSRQHPQVGTHWAVHVRHHHFLAAFSCKDILSNWRNVQLN